MSCKKKKTGVVTSQLYFHNQLLLTMKAKLSTIYVPCNVHFLLNFLYVYSRHCFYLYIRQGSKALLDDLADDVIYENVAK